MGSLKTARGTAFATLALSALVLGVLPPAAGMATRSSPHHQSPSPSSNQSISRGGALLGAAAPDKSREVGEWRVKQTGAETYELTWVSPEALPITDDRPEIVHEGLIVQAPVLNQSGRQVSVTVTSPVAPDPDDFDVELSGVILDEATQAERRPVQPASARPAATTPLTVDPGVPGNHQIVTSDYRLAPLAVKQLPAQIEMLGHVVRPAHSDPTDPLVLFLHGRHQPCFNPDEGEGGGGGRDWPCPRGTVPVPSYLGYDYAQRLLASQGYVTVSISANSINAQDYQLVDGGAGVRAALVRAHLARWARWAADGTFDVDVRNTVLVGHSRGGEGVDRAALETPLNAPYRIAGQVLIGPTDFGRQTAAYIPTATFLPYCDGDVSDLQGQIFTDAARDLVKDDPGLHSSLLMMGTNHNFFNSEWTPGISVAPASDDWYGDPDATCGRRTEARLSAAEQRNVGKTYIAGAVHLMADGDEDVLPMFDGSAVSVPSAGDADVRTSAIGGGRELRRPGAGTRLGPVDGAFSQLCNGRVGLQRETSCGRGVNFYRAPHWVPTYAGILPANQAFEMSWRDAGQSAGLRFVKPLDLSSAQSFDLRTIVDPKLGNVRVNIRLYAGADSVLVTPRFRGLVPALPGGGYSLGKHWAQTLRVQLSGVTGVDLSRVTGFDLEAVSPDGRVWVLDAAAVPPSLAPLPHKRLARIDFQDVSVQEGDGPGVATASVPYVIRGRLQTSARVVVSVSNAYDGRSLPAQSLLVPAGTISGVVEVPYEADVRDDLAVQRIRVSAYTDRGIMTRHYIATARIHDDDPSPRITITRADSRIVEGERARWHVTLAAPVDYWLAARAVPVTGQQPELVVADLPRRFVRHHIYPPPKPSTALSDTGLRLYAGLVPGHRRLTIWVPTKVDHSREGREFATMRVGVLGMREISEVRTVLLSD